MNRRPHLTLVALIVAGLIGVGLLAVPGSPIHQEPTLGLDLQGGLEVTLQAVPPEEGTLQESDLDRAVEVGLLELPVRRRHRLQDDLEAALEVEAERRPLVDR